jgi:nitrogen fixation protein FixH
VSFPPNRAINDSVFNAEILAGSRSDGGQSNHVKPARIKRVVAEFGGLLRAPQRALPLTRVMLSDAIRRIADHKHLYAFATTRRDSTTVLNLAIRWILDAQRADGGVPAYYSLLTGYSGSYPEVTGYIVPTLYDFADAFSDRRAAEAAQRAIGWLLALQMPNGAFPRGLQGGNASASIFNTGQILHGLIRAYKETGDADILRAAIAAGDWLAQAQCGDGSWHGQQAYQGVPHTYYSMVSWALAELANVARSRRHREAAERNLNWTLSHFQPGGWIDGINLTGHPTYLHFIAYVLQGAIECAILCNRNDTVEAVTKSAWILLRKFETKKYLCGAYECGFKSGRRFACLTGNAQMSCIWLRLLDLTGDLRYFNAALKMNEMLKRLILIRGEQGITGGVSGSYPIWGAYQPLRYISWGCKFLADALLLERRVKNSFAAYRSEVLQCVS